MACLTYLRITWLIALVSFHKFHHGNIKLDLVLGHSLFSLPHLLFSLHFNFNFTLPPPLEDEESTNHTSFNIYS